MRILATAFLGACLLLDLAAGASGRSTSREWLTFNQVTLDGHKRVLSRHDVFPEVSSYSPRSRKLAYAPYVADGLRSNQLWVADIDSSRDRLLFEATAWITDVAWAPNAQSIAFESNGIWLIDQDGTNPRRVGEPGAFPLWSPDSTKIAYMVLAQDGHWLIRILSLTSGSSTDLVRGQRESWSPDGTRIAYERLGVRGCGSELRIIDVSSGVSRRVACGSRPSWSPDGKLIAFLRLGDMTTSLWIVPSRGGKPRRLANVTPGDIQVPAWARDSRWLAFRQGHYCSSKLAVVRVGGGRPRRLASHTRAVTPLAWSRAGRKVLYSAERCLN